MSWLTGRLAAFDLETTGVDVEDARIVTAAVLAVDSGRLADERVWLLDPGVVIPEAASRVHGITTERARAEGRSPAEAIEEIAVLLADKLLQHIGLVAFNARFDLTVLDRELRRHGLRSLLDRVGGPDGMLVLDPLVLDKHFDRFRRGPRTLAAMCGHYGVSLEDAHAASGDAFAAALLALELGARFPELGGSDVRSLHRQQIGWAAEQAASLERYFHERGRFEHVEGAWPIVPA
jgi:DNA polymerase-3 subunit epsilon